MGFGMYNIGICDDGINVCSSLEEMILLYTEKNRLKTDVKVWYTGEELCKYLEQGGHLDILYLDIALFRLSGIEVGDFIRNRFAHGQTGECKLSIYRESQPMRKNYSSHSQWIFW